MATTFSFKTLDDPVDISFAAMQNPPIPTFTNLLGINNEGLIAGFYGSGNPGHPNQGFLLTPSSTFTAMDFPRSSQNAAVQTQLTGLNDKGIVVGYFYNTNLGVPSDNQFAFFEKNGVFTEVNNPNTPGLFGNPAPQPGSGILIENQLIGVNDHNIAVGFYNDVSGNSHGYTYDIHTGKFSANIDDPNALSGGSTVTAAINNKGTIVGFYTDTGPTSAVGAVIHGFLDKNGVFTTVDAPGAVETELLGINDHGIAVGFDIDANGVTHGVIYNTKTGTFIILDDPNAVGSTVFNGINDKGDIVGFYSDGTNTHGLLATPHDIAKLVGIMDHHA